MAKHLDCPAELTADLIGGRWKIVLLGYLFQGCNGSLTFNGPFRALRRKSSRTSCGRWRKVVCWYGRSILKYRRKWNIKSPLWV